MIKIDNCVNSFSRINGCQSCDQSLLMCWIKWPTYAAHAVLFFGKGFHLQSEDCCIWPNCWYSILLIVCESHFINPNIHNIGIYDSFRCRFTINALYFRIHIFIPLLAWKLRVNKRRHVFSWLALCVYMYVTTVREISQGCVIYLQLWGM